MRMVSPIEVFICTKSANHVGSRGDTQFHVRFMLFDMLWLKAAACMI